MFISSKTSRCHIMNNFSVHLQLIQKFRVYGYLAIGRNLLFSQTNLYTPLTFSRCELRINYRTKSKIHKMPGMTLSY
jgi:hypothetical protein